MFLSRATDNLSGYQNTKTRKPCFTNSSEPENREVALLCRQPAFHLGGDAQPPGFPERIASPLSQRHLARFSDHFRRSGIPIMALGRLCEYSFKRRANHDASRISESATRPVTGNCLTSPMVLDQFGL